MRLILDPPAGGAWNMAVDEALLADAAEHGQPTLRFYQWSEPTLSLGYFQRHEDRVSHPASRACPLVRRSSGGGAIVHDRELTYSLAMPIARVPGTSHTPPQMYRSAADLYALMHISLVVALARLGVTAWRHGEGAQSVTPNRSLGAPGAERALTSTQPFLCFQRHTEGDVLCGGVKIAGSAQRRRRAESSLVFQARAATTHRLQSHATAVLQHGSVLLSRSPAAPELAGIAEVTGRSIAPSELIELWLVTLAEQGLGPWQQSPLPGSIQEAARRISSEKYEASVWNQRR